MTNDKDMVLVPRRLTPEMAMAIERSDTPAGGNHSLVDYWQPAWDAAIAAAPQQPAAQAAKPAKEYTMGDWFRDLENPHGRR